VNSHLFSLRVLIFGLNALVTDSELQPWCHDI
jgi:hypothetical protein